MEQTVVERKVLGLPRAQLRRAAAATAFWVAALLVVDATELGQNVVHELSDRLQFAARAELDRSPKLHPRLKIFGYDDRAVAEFHDPEIGYADWQKLFAALGRRKPRAILVDKMFGFYAQTDAPHVEAFRATLAQNEVTAGAFVHSHLIRFHDQLGLERRDFRLDEMTDHKLAAAAWLPVRSPNVYGPHPTLRNAFKHIGHILYPGGGRVDPLIRVNENTAVPHMALYAAGKVRVQDDGLYLDDTFVPLDRDGRLPVNLTRSREYFEATYSMKRTITAVRAGEDLKQVEEGDVVLILPLLYTGNHDEVDTPLGRMPGGFIHAGLVSSILSKDYLRPVNVTAPAIVASAAAATAVGLLLGPVAFWPAFLALGLALVTSGLALFVYGGLVVPWLAALAAHFCGGLSGYAVNMAAWMSENRRLKDALKGAVPEAKLKAILAGRGRLKLEASERIVTLMFLDIANFSVMAEQNPPKVVFHRLKRILREVTKTIHKYGGTVDKTLGDGILCFFGYSYDGEVTENQADQAIKCAIEIQRANLRRCIESARRGEPILPFRIGINTGSVYIGDIGNEDRIDFTVIGNGVNYAQRLEAACEHHSVMMSGTTIDFSAIFSPKMPGFTRRFITIKHHEELLEAIEFDPVHEEPSLREEALKELRKTYNKERKEQRWPVDDPARLTVSTDFGPGQLIDFSTSGCCLNLESYLAKGVSFEMRLASPHPRVEELLRTRGLDQIKVEVRWGKSAETKGYAHGLKFASLTDDQLGTLFELLREVFSRAKEKAG